MSENQANLRIEVQAGDVETLRDSIRGAKTQVGQLQDKFNSLGSASDEASSDLRGVRASASQAGSSLRRVGLAAAGAVAGLATLELAKRALGGAVRGLSASITAFAETNEEAQAKLGVMSDSLEDLKLAFGEALIGGEHATIMTEKLSESMESLTIFVEENKEAIQDFAVNSLGAVIKLFSTAATVALNFAEGILFVQIAIADFNNEVNDSADRVDQFGNAIESDRDRLQRMSNAVVNLRESLSTLNFGNVTKETRTATNGWMNYASEVMGAAMAHEEAERVISGSGRDEPTGDGGANQERIQSQRDFNSNMVALYARLDEKRLESELAGIEQDKLIRTLRNEEKMEELNNLVLFEEERNRIKQEGLAKLQRAEEEAQAKLTNSVVGGAQSLANALVAVEGKSAKERRQMLKKSLGQELIQRGGALVATGIGNAIALNPKGALEIAGGVSMIAAGAKLSGGGGGGGRGGARTAPRVEQAPVQNVTFNQNTQFGFVGDRRASSRELEEINKRSVDRGLRS